MDYNFEEIGTRLRKERKAAGFKSQEMLAFKLQDRFGIIHYQRIGRWENGREVPPMDILLFLCGLYHCDLGYLLCEYDYKTRPDTDIGEATGLSEAAIEKLKYLHSAPGSSGIMEALNTILISVNFENALDHVGEYLEKSRLCHSLKENQIQNQYYSDEAQKMECQKYEAATHFSYTLDEIGSTPERRQRIFKAGMSGLFD